MYRTAVIVVLLFAMLWPSLALARVGSTVNVLADLQHAALHLHEEGHHHHDDGSYHLDDSIDASHHLMCDHVSTTTALLATSSHVFPALGSAAPCGVHKARLPSPILDGLLRPPRVRS